MKLRFMCLTENYREVSDRKKHMSNFYTILNFGKMISSKYLLILFDKKTLHSVNFEKYWSKITNLSFRSE